MYKIKFTKMHGLGNDFIMVEKNNLPQDIIIEDFIELASDRNLGIGCDQFIIYEILDKENYCNKALMDIYNSDATKAEVCGNATRCLAYIMHEQNLVNQNITQTDSPKSLAENIYEIEAAGRKLSCKITGDKRVSVNMGKISLKEPWMPESEQLSPVLSNFLTQSAEFAFADAGNPHLIIIEENITLEDINLLGPKLESHPLFERGINVNFASLNKNYINLNVWERSSGLTYACGSGACATFAVCNNLGFVGDKAVVNFSQGSLNMTMIDGAVHMEGEIAKVAEGSYYYE